MQRAGPAAAVQTGQTRKQGGARGQAGKTNKESSSKSPYPASAPPQIPGYTTSRNMHTPASTQRSAGPRVLSCAVNTSSLKRASVV